MSNGSCSSKKLWNWSVKRVSCRNVFEYDLELLDSSAVRTLHSTQQTLASALWFRSVVYDTLGYNCDCAQVYAK